MTSRPLRGGGNDFVTTTHNPLSPWVRVDWELCNKSIKRGDQKNV